MTLLALALLTQTPVTTDSQPIISSVEVRLPAGADPHLMDRVPQLVLVRKGQPLSRRAVERTIESLFATSRFADIEVLAKDAPDGVSVIIVLTPRQNIGTVFLEGNRSFAKSDVLAATKLEPGSEYWPERLERAADAVRKFYLRRGYRSVTVRTEAATVDGVLVAGFVVEEGEPSRIRSIKFEGEPGLPPPQLQEVLGLSPGSIADLAFADEGLERIRKLYREQRFYRARVEPPRLSDEGDLVVPVASGPTYDVVFSGNRAFSDASLKALLAYDGEESLDSTLAWRLAQRIERLYQYRGYHDVKVSASEVLKPGTREAALGFVIEEGGALRVADIHFDGAQQLKPGELRSLLATVVERGSPVLSLRVHGTGDPTDTGGRVSPEFAQTLPGPPGDTVLVEDAWREATKAMAALYREHGFMRAKVTFAGADATAGRATAHFVVEEGPRAHYRDVKLEGAPPKFRSDAIKTLPKHGVLSVAAVNNIEREIVRELSRTGYLFASVKSSYALDESGTNADVKFEIEPGPQARVRTVIAVGQVRTVEDVILAQATMKEGEPLDAESLYSTQANLQALNIFRTVEVEMLAPDRPEELKTVIIRVKERPRATLDPSFGYFFADGARVAVEGSVPNIGGRAITLTGRGQLNLFFFSYPALTRQIDLSGLELWQQLGGRLNASLDAPSLLPGQIGLRLDAVLERVFRPQFRFTRVAGGPTANWSHTFDNVPLIDWLKPKLSLALQYEVEWSSVERVGSALTAVPPTSLADQERLRFLFGTYALHSVRFAPALDLRDNALVPHKGLLVQGSSELTGALSAIDDQGNRVTVNFFKLAGQVTGYIPFGKRVVLALSARGGKIFPLQPGSVTPPVRRFFLGGSTSVRGFNEDQLIAEDVRARYRDEVRDCQVLANKDGCSSAAKTILAGRQVPSQGGELFAVFKSELRVPAFSVFDLGLFFEAGNLWLAAPQAFTLRPVVGAGVRYVTPIGPLALDVGVNLTPDLVINEPRAVVHFNIGGF